MQPRPYTDQTPDRTHDNRARPTAEPRSWAPRVADRDAPWDAPAADKRTTFTHNAARYSRAVEAAPVQQIDLEPELTPPPRWMMAVAGAAVAALTGALLGGFMHI